MNQLARDIADDEVVDLGDLPGSLGFLLRMAQVKTFDDFHATLAQHGMKPGEFTVLTVIGLNPGLRQGSVARTLNIKPAHMTKLVSRMVEAGYVAREVPENDRRSVRLTLTDEGAAFVKNNRAEIRRFHDRERARMTDNEYHELTRLLRKYAGFEGGEA